MTSSHIDHLGGYILGAAAIVGTAVIVAAVIIARALRGGVRRSGAEPMAPLR